MALRIGKLFANPGGALMEAKRRPTYSDAMGTLALAAVLAALAGGIAVAQLGGMMSGLTLMAAAGIFVLVLLGGLFVGLIIKLITVTLGGKGDYLHGLTAAAYTALAPSAGMLVAAIFMRIPIAGTVVSFVALALALARGVSTLYRSLKELFGTDMVTAFVAVSILAMVLAVAFWGSVATILGGQLPAIPGLPGLTPAA